MPNNILLTRPPGSPTQDLAAYREEGGYEALENVRRDSADVIDQLEAAGLRGRGGASFPVARKWRLAEATDADPKYVVANGGEHEPGSDKDKHIVRYYPHKVLEGVLICCHATGASKAYVYLIEDMAPQIEAAQAAIAEAKNAGLLGGVEVEVHRAPTTYVAGEETAAINSIEGGPGKPRQKPPYPGDAGLFGKPTTVNNVETLAHVPYILRMGAKRYRSIGTGDSTGTMLFTLGEQVQRPGVYELPFGATYRQLIEGMGGGTRSGRSIRAVLPALSCGFIAAEHMDASIDHATLRELGTSPGCGGVSLIEEGDDVVARVLEIAEFFMAEQCGQCPPCRMETNQLVHILKAVQGGNAPGFSDKAKKVSAFTRGKGLCSLIEMAAAPVLSAMTLFAEDLERAAGQT